MTTPPPATWRVPRESKEWVGPIDLAITVDGEVIEPTVDAVRFALLPAGVRPTDDDWVAPVPEPGGAELFGVQADPVDEPGRWGIFAQIVDSSETPVLDPDEVGKVIRT